MCHTLIINSDAGREHYVSRGGPLRKIVVIKNGINPKRFACTSRAYPYRAQWNLARFDQIIGMVAAMEARKDQRLLLQAMKAIIQYRPRTGLLLIGDGSRRAELENFACAAGLEDHVVFTGQVRMPEQVYPLFAIYVQASYSEEGISNSIMEAMSCSLPVVATDVGGNREVVEDGVTGRVVPAGDQDSLTHALLALLNDPPRCKQMGQAGLSRVRTDFSLERMVEATQELYETLLRPRVPTQQGNTIELSKETER
jgi:glycosyltransferase involved in cell wall biosynthesis